MKQEMKTTMQPETTRALPCHVVRDLLPAYIENLTAEDTTADIRAHLAGCPDCSAVHAAMTEGEPAPEADLDQADAKRDIDYLKKVRTGTRRRVLAVALAALVILAVPLVRYCLIGTQGPAVAYALTMNEEATELTVDGTALGSSEALARLALSQDENGVVTIAPRSVHKLFYRSDKIAATLAADKPITKVQDVFGTVYWEDGETISELGRYLAAADTPYVGDNAAMGDLVYSLDLQNKLYLPDMHLELETDKAPYGMTICSESALQVIPVIGADDPDEWMKAEFERYACVILAKVGNLDHVSLRYIAGDGAEKTITMTADEATTLTGRPIKEWAGSAADIERLLDTVGITAR